MVSTKAVANTMLEAIVRIRIVPLILYWMASTFSQLQPICCQAVAQCAASQSLDRDFPHRIKVCAPCRGDRAPWRIDLFAVIFSGPNR